MRRVLLFLCSVLSLAFSAPLYGADGGYKGFASYVPFKSQSTLSRSFQSDDSIDTSAGSPEIISKPSESEEDSSAYRPNTIPKKYDVLDYSPSPQHGYSGNKISEENPNPSPYQRATIYGQSEGGYKIADAYQNQHIDSHEDDESGYNEDEDISHPQPYEYGYALKDDQGNMQHKHETSDGHGNVKGSYGFTDEHGVYRSVEYVAGKDGFKASIKTNEPGTESQNPADVYVQAEKPDYR